MKYHVQIGQTMKTQLLSIDEIKKKLQTGEVTLDTSCMGDQGGWETIKDALAAEEQRLSQLSHPHVDSEVQPKAKPSKAHYQWIGGMVGAAIGFICWWIFAPHPSAGHFLSAEEDTNVFYLGFGGSLLGGGIAKLYAKFLLKEPLLKIGDIRSALYAILWPILFLFLVIIVFSLYIFFSTSVKTRQKAKDSSNADSFMRAVEAAQKSQTNSTVSTNGLQ